MISFKDAQRIIFEQKQLPSLKMPIRDCLGYVASKDVFSEVFIPSFVNSAVDGFAVSSTKLLNASSTNIIELKVVGRTMAGDACAEGEEFFKTSNPIGVWEVMTGACVPRGYDAVVPVEKVKILNSDDNQHPSDVSFRAPINGQANIRMPGEDYKPGSLIISKGSKLNSASILALSAIGQKMINVVAKPKVTLFSSGNEVVTDCLADLRSGQIRDANGPYLLSALDESGLAKTKFAGVLADDVDQFKVSILNALDKTDVLISSGGVSAGRHDFIPRALRDLGAEIIFHKVAIRPGKPILYARLPNDTHYFGLPGNPVSAAVGFRFFVLPLLRNLQGMPAEAPLKAQLKNQVIKNHDYHFFAKSNLSVTDGAELIVDILAGQESFKTHPLLNSNCWAVLKKNDYVRDAGDVVDVYPLTPGCIDLSKERG